MTDDLLRRLVDNVAAVAARDRKVLSVGPFQVFLSESSEDYHLSFAIPVETPGAGWAAAIDGLYEAFRRHDRVLRLEFFEERHPTLATALAARGIHRDMTAPVMILEARELRPVPAPPGVTCRLLGAADDDAIEAFLDAQWAAFGMPTDSAGRADWSAKLKRGLAGGGLMAAAAGYDGQTVCSATLLIGAGSAELAGVGTRPGHRRRGIAGHLCSVLLGAFFAEGGELAWLSAGPGAQPLYARLGFRSIATQLNYGLRKTGGG